MLHSLCKTQMVHCQYHNLILSSLPLSLHPPNHIPSLSNSFPSNPSGSCSVSAHTRPGPVSWLARAADPDGPINLLPSSPAIFATTDDPTPLQVATSIMLTGSVSIFLFRSLRRRARRAKELELSSTGASKSLKEGILDSLKDLRTGTILDNSRRPKPVQALLGGISAGVIAVILLKFTLTIDAFLNRQALSDDYSVQQIIKIIRSIVDGLFYLAIFVFGVNSVGLLLYSGKLAINSFVDNSSSEGTENKDEGGPVSSPNTTESDVSKEIESSTDTQS